MLVLDSVILEKYHTDERKEKKKAEIVDTNTEANLFFAMCEDAGIHYVQSTC